MRVVVLDANAVISHGRDFPERARAATEQGTRLVLPRSVKQELVDDVLDRPQAPPNHRDSARAIRALIEDGTVEVRAPDFETYTDVIDEHAAGSPTHRCRSIRSKPTSTSQRSSVSWRPTSRWSS